MKKLICMLLLAIMVCTVLPIGALAAEEDSVVVIEDDLKCAESLELFEGFGCTPELKKVNGEIVKVMKQVALIKPLRAKEETVIVVIKGKPGIILGLDENGFVSARGTCKKPTDVYVMSEAAFKLFEWSDGVRADT